MDSDEVYPASNELCEGVRQTPETALDDFNKMLEHNPHLQELADKPDLSLGDSELMHDTFIDECPF